MTNEEMMKQVIEDDNKEFKKYAEDKLRRVDILREMGYTCLLYTSQLYSGSGT